jgi:hypothetical protein
MTPVVTRDSLLVLSGERGSVWTLARCAVFARMALEAGPSPRAGRRQLVVRVP